MEDQFYNIVWADDEIDILFENWKSLLEESGIRVHKCYNSQDAINYIEGHSSAVDAIMIDANFPRERMRATEDFSGLNHFLMDLNRLNQICQKDYPCFILTGYGDALRARYGNDMLDIFDGIFSKSANYDVRKGYVNQIRNAIIASNSKAVKYKRLYPDLFELFSEDYLGEDHIDKVVEIFEAYERRDSGLFNKIRQLLEYKLCTEPMPHIAALFPSAQKSLNNRVDYLINKYSENKTNCHKYELKLLNFIAQEGSHTLGVREFDIAINCLVSALPAWKDKFKKPVITTAKPTAGPSNHPQVPPTAGPSNHPQVPPTAGPEKPPQVITPTPPVNPDAKIYTLKFKCDLLDEYGYSISIPNYLVGRYKIWTHRSGDKVKAVINKKNNKNYLEEIIDFPQ